MNIFFVDKNPVLAAQMLCNAHVRSQIKESIQMLCTAHYLIGEDNPEFEPPTHKHHPCTKWIMESDKNYQWLHRHLCALLDEYKYRHGNANWREKFIPLLEEAPDGCPYTYEVTIPPAVVAPDLKPKPWSSKTASMVAVVEAYRAYYNRDKRHLHHWMVREKPNWITPWVAIPPTILTEPLKTLTTLGPRETWPSPPYPSMKSSEPTDAITANEPSISVNITD